ncbi:hypothetical protein B9G98_04413 [Wickerhamiella sorbophila]|uniref:Uncharacterized protein n=1 Tax=Wickerhamiella sorbophila TaxID=45607 RepID=A0A2T0FP76_9ASCO|nr:hypothetical protein B9G98_04413 [Wickerhamiella sorbophila]PRT56793.1 hypothetical protein B9G98_04413 [Wickerhamiella sorbophila]
MDQRVALESGDLRYVYRLLSEELEKSLDAAIDSEKAGYPEDVKAEALAAAKAELRKTFEMARFAVNISDVRVESTEDFRMYCEENYGAEPLDLELNQQVFNELGEIDHTTDGVARQRTRVASEVAELYRQSTQIRLATFDKQLSSEEISLPELNIPFERVESLSEDLRVANEQSQALQSELRELIAKMTDIKNGIAIG